MTEIRTMTHDPAREHSGWFDEYRRGHLWVSAALSVLVAVAFASPVQLGDGLQLGSLAVAVALLGLPHGALDHLVGRRLLRPRFGNRWPLIFFPSYVTLAGLVVLLWWVAPRLMLSSFLVYSAWHFGVGDLLAEKRSSGSTRLLALARGILPLALPAAFHPQEVTRYFNWLLPSASALVPSTVSMVASVGLLASVSLLAALFLSRVPGALSGFDAVELATLTILFANAPPLVSFLVYFCVWHSIRHLLDLGHELSPDEAREAMRRLWRAAWPLTLVTVGAAGASWALLRSLGATGEIALGQVLFIGLAALTVPHMALGSLVRRIGTRPHERVKAHQNRSFSGGSSPGSKAAGF